MARHVLLKSGIPLERNAYNVNRLCGSGFQSIINGTQVGSYFFFFKKITGPTNKNLLAI